MVIEKVDPVNDSEFSYIIASEPDGLHFYQIYHSYKYDTYTFLEMTYNSGSRYVSLYVEDEFLDGVFIASAEVDALNYVLEETYVNYSTISNSSSLSYKEFSEYNNEFFDLAVNGWNILLRNETGISMAELGFSHFCNNHRQTIPWYIEEPTCSESGKVEYICKYCGRIMDTVDAPPTGKHNYVNTTMPATTTNNGKVVSTCSVCGNVQKTTVIQKIASVKLNKASFVYNGATQKPTVTVKDAKGKVVNSKYYSVQYPKGCAEVGTYKVTVVFKGLYSGKTSCTFKIVPGKATDLKAVSKKAGIAKLKWSEIDGAQKYVIYYSKNSKSGFQKLTSTTKTAYNVKNLKSGVTYYFYIKAYAKVGGTGLYGAKSKVASTKIK